MVEQDKRDSGTAGLEEGKEQKIQRLKEKIKETFNRFNFTFTSKTYMLCVKYSVTLDDLVAFTPTSNYTLIKLAGGDLDDEAILKVIDTWLQAGFSLKLLHTELLELAEQNGFFTTGEEMDFYSKVLEDNPNKAQFILPSTIKEWQTLLMLNQDE